MKSPSANTNSVEKNWGYAVLPLLALVLRATVLRHVVPALRPLAMVLQVSGNRS
jgi:hypothetical protein